MVTFTANSHNPSIFLSTHSQGYTHLPCFLITLHPHVYSNIFTYLFNVYSLKVITLTTGGSCTATALTTSKG